jgi:DNA-binding MarR family transcriptional regulator
MLKDIPHYESLLNMAKKFPSLDSTAWEACLYLLRTADLIAANSHTFFKKHNLSQSRFTVLTLLTRPGLASATPASLADKAAVTRATMTGLIDTLEKDGMVMRVPDPLDRRTMHIELTAAGRAKLEEILPECYAKIATMLAPLNSGERGQLVALLQKIDEGLSTAAPGETEA